MSITAAAPEVGRTVEAELIQAHATAIGTACEQMTASALKAIGDSAERAVGLPSRPGWERKAAAHAEIFHLLADAAIDPETARVLVGMARLMRDLMATVGPAANAMITNSRRRLLAHLRARDTDGAVLEMENHLRVLHYMWRLAVPGRPLDMILAMNRSDQAADGAAIPAIQ